MEKRVGMTRFVKHENGEKRNSDKPQLGET